MITGDKLQTQTKATKKSIPQTEGQRNKKTHQQDLEPKQLKLPGLE